MMKSLLIVLLTSSIFVGAIRPSHASDPNCVKIANGSIEGTTDSNTGVREFKGIPYAQPPLGNLRWKTPQPLQNWKGVRPAKNFGPQGMQKPFSDMVFRCNGMSEDSLYLNVWTPAKSDKERLPVLVYFYGGGFISGDGSEPRYDGESMATNGIVSMTVNYRVGVFGFLAHPELTAESPNHSSGNYGLLDQVAALQWVQRNIEAFGGDPNRVTIAGESAGSFSVSALMASPLSKDLFAGAIGESGALMEDHLPVPLADGEQNGIKFMNYVGAKSIAEMRAMSAQQLLDATTNRKSPKFKPVIDGYYLPESLDQIYESGQQAHVPLLVGWNSQEASADSVLKGNPATPSGYASAVMTLYPTHGADILSLYPGTNSYTVWQSATDLASDLFIAQTTWKWSDIQGKTGGKPVYRYFFSKARPQTAAPASENAASPVVAAPMPPVGAVHSGEIEYAMGNLASNHVYAWTPDDYKVSKTMQAFFVNFIKTGNPNGRDLPNWPPSNQGETIQLMHIDVYPYVETDSTRDRHLLLDPILSKPKPN